jgi:maltodextrin utilization protein YvdJ
VNQGLLVKQYLSVVEEPQCMLEGMTRMSQVVLWWRQQQVLVSVFFLAIMMLPLDVWKYAVVRP